MHAKHLLVEILGLYQTFDQIFSRVRKNVIEKCGAYTRIPVVPLVFQSVDMPNYADSQIRLCKSSFEKHPLL